MIARSPTGKPVKVSVRRDRRRAKLREFAGFLWRVDRELIRLGVMPW